MSEKGAINFPTILLLILGTLILVVSFARMLNRKPLLTLTERGIKIENGPFYKWENIQTSYVEEWDYYNKGNSKFLIIKSKSTEKVLEKINTLKVDASEIKITAYIRKVSKKEIK